VTVTGAWADRHVRHRSSIRTKGTALPEINDRTERARALVKSFYEGGAEGQITRFANHLDDRFELFVPGYLPWGGTFGKAEYVALLPQVAQNLDFGRMTYESLTAEGGHVVALIRIAVRDTDEFILISEHWDISEEDKATRLLVAYFDAQPLLARQAALPD
jgi:ketosteroid isomerase-like protein